MSVKTETFHAEEFLLREGNGDISREAATVASGQVLVDGQVVKDNGSGKMIAAAGNHDSGDDSTEAILGVVIGNWDSSATGTNADILGVPYIARMATVKDMAITYHTGGADALKKAAVKGKLKEMLIIQR